LAKELIQPRFVGGRESALSFPAHLETSVLKFVIQIFTVPQGFSEAMLAVENSAQNKPRGCPWLALYLHLVLSFFKRICCSHAVIVLTLPLKVMSFPRDCERHAQCNSNECGAIN
jgi:hypothetical protein